MRVLFLGDIVGRSGRKVVTENLPELRLTLGIDFVVANGENAAAGFGLTGKIADQLFAAGCDVISGGNHTLDQKDIFGTLNTDSRVLRPLNYPDATPGRGVHLYDAPRGKKVLVINAMGRVFMNPLDCPFAAVDAVLKANPLGRRADFILVDFHGEASSEKMAMGHHLDGRVSLVVGTHTHVPTADTQILPGGTAYQTDAGMCGDYNSVIGMQKDEPVRRFITRQNRERFQPAGGEATLCGVLVDSDDATGLASAVTPIRIGPRLVNSLPDKAG